MIALLNTDDRIFFPIYCETPLFEVRIFQLNSFRHPMLPDSHQQLAIQARLNMLLGAKIYDDLFLGFECGVVFDHTAHVYVRNENKAAFIEAHYGWHVSVAVESILKLPIKAVQVLPRDFSDSPSA